VSIEKMKNGRYRIRYYADGVKAEGRRIQETLEEGTAYKDAMKKYQSRLARAADRRARGTIERDIGFEALAEEYLEVHGPRLSERWRKGADSIIRKRLIPRFGPRPVASLKPLDLERYVQERQAETKTPAPATINRELVLLKGILSKGRSWGFYDSDPIPRGSVRRLPEPSGRLIFFEVAEWGRFIAALESRDKWIEHRSAVRRFGDVIVSPRYPKGRRHGAGLIPESEASLAAHDTIRSAVPLFRMLLYTGSRVGEIIALRWRQIDFDHGVVKIHQTKTNSEKTLPLSAPMLETLKSIPRGFGEQHVFRRPEGGPWDRGLVRDALEYGKRAAGKLEDGETPAVRPELVVHSIRHTLASWLVIEGTPLRTVQEVLGHRSITMTERYSHLAPVHLRESLDLVGTIEKRAETVENSIRRHLGATSAG
jgi:integrase